MRDLVFEENKTRSKNPRLDPDLARLRACLITLRSLVASQYPLAGFERTPPAQPKPAIVCELIITHRSTEKSISLKTDLWIAHVENNGAIVEHNYVDLIEKNQWAGTWDVAAFYFDEGSHDIIIRNNIYTNITTDDADDPWKNVLVEKENDPAWRREEEKEHRTCLLRHENNEEFDENKSSHAEIYYGAGLELKYWAVPLGL